MATRQLVKSRNNRLVSGVIAGIGEYFGLSRDIITFLRILVVVLFFGSWGTLVVVYFIALIIIPSSETARRQDSQTSDSAWKGADKFEEKMARKQAKWERKQQEREDRWSGTGWDSHPTKPGQKIKEAKPIKDEKEDDWSDF